MKMYYTDPLKAQWMKREFGVQTKVGKFVKSLTIFSPDSDEEKQIDVCSCYIISPESESVFEPMAGDLVRKMTNGMCYVVDSDDCKIAGITPVDSPAAAHYKRTDCKQGVATKSLAILQRNGKQFFMPEMEND